MAIFKESQLFPDRVYVDLLHDKVRVYMDNLIDERIDITNYCSRIELLPGEIMTAYFYQESEMRYPVEIPVKVASITGTWMSGVNNDKVGDFSIERAEHSRDSNVSRRVDGDMPIQNSWCSMDSYKA